MAKKNQTGESHISFIHRGCRIEGHLFFEGHLIIEGTIDGILDAESVFIEKGGCFSGKIQAKLLSVAGYFEGEMEVTDTLTLKGSADVEARILCRKLVVEEGGLLNGNLKFLQPGVKPAAVERMAEVPVPSGSR